MGGDSQNFRTDFENVISRPVKPVKTGKNKKSLVWNPTLWKSKTLGH